MFLSIAKHLPLSVAFVDAKGNPAKVDGVPAWALTDTSLADLEMAADGMTAMLKPKGVLGACKVQVTADADLGAGVKTIVGELDMEFIAAEAVAVAISAGEPVDPVPVP